jgi:GT2 family glycosyltransferase
MSMGMTGVLQYHHQGIDADFLVGFCLMISREMLNEIGLLDEVFSPGYGEEIDYAQRIVRAGHEFKCVCNCNVVEGVNYIEFPITHHDNKTFGKMKEYGSIIARNDLVLAQRYKRNEVGITGVLRNYNEDIEHSFLVFFCVMIKREVFDKIGMLDEVFSPGYGEDTDFCIRAGKAGYTFTEVVEKQIIDGNNYGEFPLWHKSNKTFGEMPEYNLEVVHRNDKILAGRYKKESKMGLEDVYYRYWYMESDINQHFPMLRRYAKECKHITEFGTGNVVSIYAFMVDSPDRLITYDKVPSGYIWMADQVAKENSIDFSFMERDTTNIEIEETDLLFIDTYHTAAQLQKELALHAKKVRKYIIIHQIVKYGAIGEDGGLGMLYALLNLDMKEWMIREWQKHNNGVLVLQRL